MTTRRNDGFSMRITKANTSNIVDASPYGMDAIRALAEEARAQGPKINFYYSFLDWHYPAYSTAGCYPAQYADCKPREDWPAYIAFMKAQLTELLTRYGPIPGILFDGQWDRKTNYDWHL